MESNGSECKPSVMVTNDDGIDAPGLRSLVRVLVSSNLFNVLVCAPDSEKSAVSHCVSWQHPLSVKKVDISGATAFAVLFLGFQNASSVMPVVAVERTVFYRERAAGMYSSLPYAFGQTFIEIPYVFVQAVTYAVIIYAMIGFEWTVSKFFWYLFIMYFTFLYFTFYGMMSVAVSPNQNIAQIVSLFGYSMWNLFSGFMIPRPSMPIWWRWYYWADPVAWTLYGLVVSQFGDLQDKITDIDETSKQFLRRYFGFKHDFLGVVAAVTVAYAVVFAFTFGLAIKFFNFQKR